MKKAIVIYKTKYGAAKQYASWIAGDLGCECRDFDCMKKRDLEEYDLVIYGGGVHAGGIRGFDKFLKWMRKYLFLVDKPEKDFLIFTCGINVQNFEARAQLRDVNFHKKWLRQVTCFYFDGSYDPKNVKGIDKKIMGLAINMLKGKGELNFTNEDKELMDKMLNGYSNVSCDQIANLVKTAKEL